MTWRHIDLFSGIGGFSLSAQTVWGDEHEIVCFVEQDEFCQKVLGKHWPAVPIISDIHDFNLDTFVNLCYNQLSSNKKEIIDMGAKRKNYDEAVNMYDKGLSIQDVADFHGVTRQAMWMVLKLRGCQFRNQLKFGKENHFYRGGERASGRVHDIVELALEKGILARTVLCEKCEEAPTFKNGRTAIQSHHDNYNKPLEVRWLCQHCHHKWHKTNTAKELEIELPTMTRKEICSLGGKASHKNQKGGRELVRELEDATNVSLLTGGFP